MTWVLVGCVAFVIIAVLAVLPIIIPLRNAEWRQQLICHEPWLSPASNITQVIAVVLAVLTALISFIVTSGEQRTTAQVEAQAAVTSVMQDHLQLATQHPQLATVQQPDVITERFTEVEQARSDPTVATLKPEYSWFASHAVFTAQTIYNQMEHRGRGSGDWNETVAGLVWRHNSYVCNEVAFPKNEYTQGFLDLIEDLKKVDNDFRPGERLCDRDEILRPYPFTRFADKDGNNLPNVTELKSGDVVEIRFGMNYLVGTNILAAGYPKVTKPLSCPPANPVPIDSSTVTAKAGRLQLEEGGWYAYVWKTKKEWEGCRQLVFKFTDSVTVKRATFKFIQ